MTYTQQERFGPHGSRARQKREPTPRSVLADARQRLRQCQRDGTIMTGKIPPELRAEVVLYHNELRDEYQNLVNSGSYSPICVTDADLFLDNQDSDFTPHIVPRAEKGKCKLCSRKKRRKRKRKSKRRR